MTPEWQEWILGADHLAIDWAVLTLLILAAFMVIFMRNLLASAVLLGVFSLLMAFLYLLFDAPDVALTEAAVGAGISTLLFLCTLSFTEREQRPSSLPRQIVPFLVVLVVGSVLIYATEDLPAFASPDAPIHQHVAPYYINEMEDDIDIDNIVTAVLGSYRGFDTMGEVAVVFIAGISIAALLMNIPQIRNTPPRAPAHNSPTPAPSNPAPAPAQPRPAPKPAATAPRGGKGKSTAQKAAAAKKSRASKKGKKS